MLSIRVLNSKCVINQTCYYVDQIFYSLLISGLFNLPITKNYIKLFYFNGGFVDFFRLLVCALCICRVWGLVHRTILSFCRKNFLSPQRSSSSLIITSLSNSYTATMPRYLWLTQLVIQFVFIFSINIQLN